MAVPSRGGGQPVGEPPGSSAYRSPARCAASTGMAAIFSPYKDTGSL